MWEYLLFLNEYNLFYFDIIYFIVVYFVIGMVLFVFLCDIIGYFICNFCLYEVSWWNMFFVIILIFIVIIFG